MSKALFKYIEAFKEFLADPDIEMFMTRLFEDGFPWGLLIGIIIFIVVLVNIIKKIFGKKQVWEYKDREKAMKALDDLDELDYKKLLTVEEKSPFPEVQQAAREKNRLGYTISDVLKNPHGSRRFAEPEMLDFKSERAGKTESGTLVVFTRGFGGDIYFHRVTYCLPDDIKPSCPEAAEYRLELKIDTIEVGSYSDGHTAGQSYVKGILSRKTEPVWEQTVYGGKPPEQKYWGSANNTGTPADAAPLVLRAVGTIRAENKSGGK